MNFQQKNVLKKIEAHAYTGNKSQYFTMYSVQNTKTCEDVKETRRIKSEDAIKLIETGLLANSRFKRKEQSDK